MASATLAAILVSSGAENTFMGRLEMSDAYAGIAISRLVGNITSGLDRLDEQKQEVRAAHSAAEQARAIGEVHAEVAELRLYLATVVSLLIFKEVITSEEFEKIGKAIDALDGVVDGRFDGEIAPAGKIRRGAGGQGSQALRELAAIVRGEK